MRKPNTDRHLARGFSRAYKTGAIRLVLGAGKTVVAAAPTVFGPNSASSPRRVADGVSCNEERVEAHSGGASVVLNDFRSVEMVTGGKRRKVTTAGKGHAEEIAALVAAVKAGGPSPISRALLFATTRATLRVHGAIASADHAMSTRTST
jgi:hypothetical protein